MLRYHQQVVAYLVEMRDNTSRSYPNEESLYDLTENLTENDECCKLLQFLRAEIEDMSAEELQEVKQTFKFVSKNVHHEELINNIIDYGKSQVFSVITYVSTNSGCSASNQMFSE